MAGTLAAVERVLEIGSVNINGTVRGLFPGADYTGIDIVAGEGVDVVADGATYTPPDGEFFDLIISTEVLEHAENAPLILANAYRLLRPGGVLILTAAGEGRRPHSAVDGGELRPGEFYRNVTRALLAAWLAPFAVSLIQETPPPPGGEADIYALAIKGV